jgi:Amt family ammonium transporter
MTANSLETSEDLLTRLSELEGEISLLKSALTLSNAISRLNDLNSTENDLLVVEESPIGIDTGDTAWMLTSTTLVLFMTLPGLILYYAGMVRVQNVLATAMQIFSITCLISALWMFFGYSLAFGPADVGDESSSVIGNGSRLWLLGMHPRTVHQLAPNIPEPLFCAFQMTFAIITPSLIVGSFADRMKYVPMLLFMALWHVLVYCPIAHSVWHPDGFLFRVGALDFAGGTVVHVSAGVSGLMSTLVIGNRSGFGDDSKKHLTAPHNILLTVMGTCMLWVGWFGFNAGSAVSSGGLAATAFLNTFLATAFGAISWLLVEWSIRRKPSVLGMVNGAVAGLVCITPACGYVNPTASYFIGTIGGIVCYFGSQMKYYFLIDDALDAFGVHAVGGIVGGILTGFFSNEFGLFYAPPEIGFHQLWKQIYTIILCAGWAAFMSLMILLLLNYTIGLRVPSAVEENGLDKKLFREEIVLHIHHHQPLSLFDDLLHASINLVHNPIFAHHHHTMDDMKSTTNGLVMVDSAIQ